MTAADCAQELLFWSPWLTVIVGSVNEHVLWKVLAPSAEVVLGAQVRHVDHPAPGDELQDGGAHVVLGQEVHVGAGEQRPQARLVVLVQVHAEHGQGVGRGLPE